MSSAAEALRPPLQLHVAPGSGVPVSSADAAADIAAFLSAHAIRTRAPATDNAEVQEAASAAFGEGGAQDEASAPQHVLMSSQLSRLRNSLKQNDQ